MKLLFRLRAAWAVLRGRRMVYVGCRVIVGDLTIVGGELWISDRACLVFKDPASLSTIAEDAPLTVRPA